MNSNVSLQRFSFSFLFTMLLCFTVQAAQLTCDACGMYIEEQGRNHIILKSTLPNAKPMHACSPACAHKLRNHDPKMTQSEVVDFNHPENFISGEKAYFLIQSTKIKSAMGENVMAPYAPAFSSKKEAEAAKLKYGDGIVVFGADNAFK